MKMIFRYIVIIFSIIAIVTCRNNSKIESINDLYIVEYKYERTDAVGPEGLVCFIKIPDKYLREKLLQNYRNNLVFKYSGGIYDIDSLYFPRPFIDIFSIHDSTMVFSQAVYGFRRYSSTFMDSIISKTKSELIIEIADTITKDIWTITKRKQKK